VYGRKILCGAVASIMTTVLAACGSGGTPAATPAATVIRLGTLVPLSGRSSHSGESMLRGAELAVSEANAAGGVLGRQIELVAEDDACDPGTAVTAAQDMTKKDIVATVGGYCSSAVVPTLKIFRDAGVPMIVAQANSTDLIAPKYDSVFLICGTVAAEATFAVGWMKRLGGRRLAVVHDGTSFPMTLADSTVADARRTGALTVTAELKLSQGAPSYRRIADTVRAGGADIVYYTGYYAEANQLIKDLRGRGFTGKIVVGDGATDGPLLTDLTAEQRRGVYGTALIFPQFMPGIEDWTSRYRAAYGSAPGPSTVESYDAVRVALDAIKRAGSVEHEAVRAAITTTDLAGTSGPIGFNHDGTRTKPTFLMLHANGDAFELQKS